jgi:hypothetical protein
MVQRIMGKEVSNLHVKKMLVLCLNFLFFWALLQTPVFAQERQGLLLNASLTVKSDPNITRTETSDKISDKSAIFSPQIQYLSNIDQHQIEFDYQGDFVVYKNNSEYNNNRHEFKLATFLDHSARVDTAYTLGYQNKTEEPGTTNAATPLGNEFNVLIRKSVLATLFYGTPASSGQFVFDLAHDQQRYPKNDQGFRDTDQSNFTSTFFYRMAPKTRLLLEASLTNIDYVVVTEFADQSSSDTLYLAGLEWEATATTSGIFKLGYQSKSYDDVRLKDLSGLSYSLDMSWQPNTFSKLTFGATKLTNESAQQDIGGSINTLFSIGLEQAFTSLTSMNVMYQQDKSEFSSAQNRTDKRKSFEVGLVHSLQTWLDISLGYRHLTRDSDDALFDFSLNMIELSITTNFQ